MNQVVSKDTDVVNQGGVRSSGLVNTEPIASQSAGGRHPHVTQDAIEVTAAKQMDISTIPGQYGGNDRKYRCHLCVYSSRA